MHRYTISGNPIPLKRPRVTRNGTYNPQKDEQERVRYELLAQRDHDVINKPVAITMTFTFSVPRSYHKRKRQWLLEHEHVYRPDLSNLIKFYEDAMLGILVRDDSIISHIHAHKQYGQTASTRIEIKEIICQ